MEATTVDEMKSGSNAMIVFVLGAAIGAAAALLYAPANGRETRRRIGVSARRLGERVAGEADDLKHQVIDRASELNGDVKDAIDAGLAAAAA
jgi:gas vesicle protein